MLNLRKAAALLDKHPETLRIWAKQGKIPAAKIENSWVFIQEDLESWVRAKYAVAGIPKEEVCHIVVREATRSKSQLREYDRLLGLTTGAQQKSSKRSSTTKTG